MTEQDLKLALSKMLPEKMYIENGLARWLYDSEQHLDRSLKVFDTEWLHVCWLVRVKNKLNLRVRWDADWQEQASDIIAFVKGQI